MIRVKKDERHYPVPGHETIKYPWHELRVGDSFTVRYGKYVRTQSKEAKRIRTRVYAAAGYMRRYGGMNLVVRSVPRGIRVWRAK